MFDKLKNLKLTRKAKESSNPTLKFVTYSNKSNLDRSTTDYLEAVTGIDTSSVGDVINQESDDLELEAMVRAQLKQEFPNIESMKSYELLVDAVIHNLRKKQLQTPDSPDIE